MQNEPVILLPTTHEQSTPTFHVEASIADEFLAFLDSHGLQPFEPPEPVGNEGPDRLQVIEVRLEANTPEDTLERLRAEFLSKTQ